MASVLLEVRRRGLCDTVIGMNRSVAMFRLILLGVWACAMCGCASGGNDELRALEPVERTRDGLVVRAIDYPAAFEAAKQELLRLGFDLERVDARHGVIATDPKETAGLASIWDKEQSTILDEVGDMLHRHERVVRVVFVPADGSEVSAIDGVEGVLAREAPVEMRVDAVVFRVHRPGWRINTVNVRGSTRSFDPALAGRAMLPRYEVGQRRDGALADRVLQRVEDVLASGD